MTPIRSRPETPAALPGDERGWLPTAAFIFVMVSLLALAITPAVLMTQVAKMADETGSTLLPANDALRDVVFALEERVVATRSRFLTNDPSFDVRLAQARLAEQESLQALTDLAPRLGGSVGSRMDALHRLVATRDSIEDRIARGDSQLAGYRDALPRLTIIRDSMLMALSGVRTEVMRAAESRAAAEARLTQLQRGVSFVLGTMSLAAVLVVWWFALRQRELRREVQAALDEANRQRTIAERRGDELERVTEARARLLRGVTHDVKNPLGSARGYAKLLQMGVKAPMLPEQAPLLDGVVRSIDSALSMISDLLDLARADSGRLWVNRVQIDLIRVTRDVVDSHQPQAEAAGHQLQMDAADYELTVHTDPDRVAQVLGNLLSNAIKYTPAPGRIVVSVALRRTEVDGGHRLCATVQVRDNGPGIPVDQREAVFDEFSRLDDGTQHGHGLGLAIARRMSRLLGGNLTVEEAHGGGANFVLWLPLRVEDGYRDDG